MTASLWKKGLILKNAVATQQIAQCLGSCLLAGDILVLNGDLGTGKTTFTQGLAKGLGIAERVKSPTYTLIREYDTGRLPLYHMDVYRLEGASDLGLDEYFEGDGVCVVEWGELISAELPSDFLVINLETLANFPEQRRMTFQTHGKRSLALLVALENKWKEEHK